MGRHKRDSAIVILVIALLCTVSAYIKLSFKYQHDMSTLNAKCQHDRATSDAKPVKPLLLIEKVKAEFAEEGKLSIYIRMGLIWRTKELDYILQDVVAHTSVGSQSQALIFNRTLSQGVERKFWEGNFYFPDFSSTSAFMKNNSNSNLVAFFSFRANMGWRTPDGRLTGEGPFYEGCPIPLAVALSAPSTYFLNQYCVG